MRCPFDPNGVPHVELLISASRHGNREALGELLDSCRQYLVVMASFEVDHDLQSKVGASDVVQDTFTEASRDFGQFRGESSAELWAWLGRILRNNIANLVRCYRGTNKRNIRQEMPLRTTFLTDVEDFALASEDPTPSAILRKEETAQAVQAALQDLPPDYHEVIRLRNHDQLTFQEIGERIGRSAEASRKLWARAVERLQQELARRE